jgi:paraquat-inducible protein B
MPEAVAVRRSHVSLVWLIPLVALIAAGWLAYKTFTQQGPVVQIGFQSAAGLEAGKTKVKFKDVDVGQVSAIDLAPDLKTVIVTAQLKYGAAAYLTGRTRFWVERPRVKASRVSGLETLLSGPYVAIDPVPGDDRVYSFVGLEEPPLFTTSEPGKRFLLRSANLGSLNIGSPVYYRQIQVGQVVGSKLDEQAGQVTIELFVSAPYDRLVYKSTRFWNSSGIDFTISASGAKLDTQSLLSVLIGGVSFDTLDTLETIEGAPVPAESGDEFAFYASRDEAHEKVYTHKERYLMFFQGSGRGLTIGAPVLLEGIPVGRVLDVQLTFNEQDFGFYIHALIEVEPDRVGAHGRRTALKVDEVVQRLVERGMRGQLRSGSLLTGQLYVDLAFHPEAPPATIEHFGDHPVLPTVPPPPDALALANQAALALERMNSILAKVEAMPIEGIGRDAQATVAGARALVDSAELKGAVAEAQAAFAGMGALVERLDRDIAPELSSALNETSRTMKYFGQIVAERSPLYIELRRMFQDLSAAAGSVKVLTDYLERHPEALLKGKGTGK